MSNDQGAQHVQNVAKPAAGDASAGRAYRLRWWPVVVILALSGAAVGLVQWRYANETTWREPMTMIVGMATAFALFLWWCFASGLRPKTRMIGGAVVLGAIATFFVLFEKDEFTGSVIPRFRFRFAKSSEEKAIDYFADAESKEAVPLSARAGSSAADGGAKLDAADADWPGFRGPRRDGIVRGAEIRTNWSEDPPQELWRHPVGKGWSSFAVVDGLAYTQEQRGGMECVVCYDALTGEQQWLHEDAARFSETQGGDGPRCTPTVYEGRLYALGATGILNCLDPLSGELHWTRNVLEDAGSENLIWGMAGSPLAYDDLVVVNPGSNESDRERAVIAYDVASGEIHWANGSHQAAYAAPRLETVDGVRQVLIFDAAGLAGLDPETGVELWRYPWVTFSDINVAQPIVRNETEVFLGSGYSHGCALLNVTQDDGEWRVTEMWKRTKPPKFQLKFQSAVHRDGFLYGLDDGWLTCLDWNEGEITWPRTREAEFRYGQLLLAGDVLIVTDERGGDVAAVKATPEGFQQLGRFNALPDGITWNHPVLWQGRLLVRNAKQAACFDVSAGD